MLTALLLAVLAGNTWYVDVNAVPPGNGTQASPYTSIQFALDQAATTHGDRLSVAPGLYVENIVFVKRVVVEATAGPIATMLRAATPGTCVLSTAGETSGPGGYEAAAIVGFTIDGSGNASGIGARVNLDSSVLGVRRCIITGFTSGLGAHQNMTNWLDMVQCTIAGNQFGVRSDTIVHGGSLYLGACIVRDNGLDAVNGTTSSGYNVQTSCVPSALVPHGSGNFTGAAGFWDTAARDYRLRPLSPCVDRAGGIGLPLDPDGSAPDVGALAFDPGHAPFPTTYCTPKPNSAGCSPLATWSGSPSVSGPDNFFLNASPALNNKPGLFLWSRAPEAAPFAGGTLCVKSPIVRGPALSSGGSPSGNDCTGAYSWHFSQAYMLSKGVAAGDVLYAQLWGRDPGFAPPNQAQLSDAIVFPIGP